MNKEITIDLSNFQRGIFEGVKDGYQEVTKSGKLSNVSAMVMVGYLSSAANAFELVGDDYNAKLFKSTAVNISKNWKDFMHSMQMLFQTMSIEQD